MSDSEVVLYDLQGKRGAWSPNVWKTRLVLNYKGIPYRTVFIPPSRIQETVKELGVPPNAPGPHSPYTVPTVRLPDGSYVMDSLKIAPKLEEVKPEPPLRLEAGFHLDADAAIRRAMGPLIAGVIFPTIGRNVTPDEDREYYYESKKRRLGKSLDECEATMGGDAAWDAAAPGIADVKALLADHKVDRGPYILGSEVSYGDFLLAAMMEGIHRMDRAVYDRIVAHDGEALLALHKAFRPWIENDK